MGEDSSKYSADKTVLMGGKREEGDYVGFSLTDIFMQMVMNDEGQW